MDENIQLTFIEMEKKEITHFRGRTSSRRSRKAIHFSSLIRESIETIYELIVNTENWKDDDQLCFSWTDLFDFAEIPFRIIADELRISYQQILILCCLINRHDDIYITESDLARDLNCSLIGFMKFHEEIESLKKLRFINVRKEDDNSGYRYRVVNNLIDALRKGETFSVKMTKYKKLEDMFPAANEIFKQRENDWLDYDCFIRELRMLVKANKHLRFSSEIIKMKLSDEDFFIVFYFCITFFLFKKVYNSLYALNDYIKSISTFMYTEALFDNGEHELIKRMIIERDSEHDNLVYHDDDRMYRLTAKTFDDLLSELPAINNSSIKNGYISNKKTCNDTIEKKLFYNEEEEENIRKLEFIMVENNYQVVLKRLKDRKMPGGVTCFFYGSPGTGKTETALQLALKTGREIMHVDLSAIKSAFVGESEGNVKAIFDQYRTLKKRCSIAPILLVNEADGIFTNRVMVNKDSRNPTIAQMQNTMQNIILNELDVFEGILIATTNLSDNMDRAFERRFLYKIEFKKPNVKVRKAIWCSLLPELSEEKTCALADKYNFSGGEIHNIARKSNIDYILAGKKEDYDSIIKLCDSEQRGIYSMKETIGFKTV